MLRGMRMGCTRLLQPSCVFRVPDRSFYSAHIEALRLELRVTNVVTNAQFRRNCQVFVD